MSIFKKPKRNIRSRDLDIDDSESDGLEISSSVRKSSANKSYDVKKKEKKKPSVLSFEEEWNEADDGEVFQVKKTSHSKKIKKILEKEKEKDKDKKKKKDEDVAEIRKETVQFLNDDLTIKIRHNLPLNPVLNGKEAEMADIDGNSSEDEKRPGHKFSHTDSVKQLLKSGKIPDAAMIHAARKRRQQAREMGDFIPIEEKPSKFENKKSRLVREDDHDLCDDDVRINMEVNTAAADKERRRAEFDAAHHDQGSEDSDKGEEEEWEKQQIRKGVTGAQIAAAQQETLYYGYTMPSVIEPLALPVEAVPMVPLAVPAALAMPVPPPEPFISNKLDPQSVAKRLMERLDDLKQVHRRHTLDKDEKTKELEELKAECVKINTEAPSLADRFRFYQDLRGYVTDLVECLDEKVVIINALDQRLLALYCKRAELLTSRRRQDMRDQADELNPNSKSAGKRDEAQVRRAAEREGRRIRRMKAREANRSTIRHVEGMSSDDEVTETQAAAFRKQRAQIEQDSRHVFEDALNEFSTVKGVLERFNQWKTTDKNAYEEAYMHLCLPKALGPLIRLQILFWSPFNSGEEDLERTGWSHRLLQYGLHEGETVDSLRADPDVELVPRGIDKIIIPKLQQIITNQWDPMSRTHSVALVACVTRLMQDYPTLGPQSRPLTALLNNIADRLRDAVDNDVFIPIYPKVTIDGRMSAFFHRQFACAVKLLSNIVRWQGVLSDETIGEIALDSLLNRYLLMAIRISEPSDAGIKCHMVGTVLPRVWLHAGNVPSRLLPFLNQARTISQQLSQEDKPPNRDALEKLSGLLKAAP